jgi:uncharacterized protein YdbL (DUF1318 family)
MSFCLVFVFSVNAGIKDRFAARLPKINKLKETLAVGENNKGYLEIKNEGISDTDKKVIEEENSDRKKVYKMLAGKTGVSLNIVENRRAIKIAEKSKKGIWLQKPDGTWYKK